jgi:2-amino-4-hydroxy-6-hydroxymethyldihydropteridine diphosphokinase
MANIRQALQILKQSRSLTIETSSSVYETEPWGYNNQSRFLNCTVKCSTILHPLELLQLAKSIETQIGRHPTFRNGPRIIDVDLLLYGDKVISIEHPDLQIPHIRMTERAFVMIPLAEIAPNHKHPILNTDMLELSRKIVVRNDDVTLWPESICARDLNNI